MALLRSMPAGFALLLLIANPGVCDDRPTEADFTRIANDGSELAAGATPGVGHSQWACLRDNNTGLVWEVKTADAGLRDRRWTYTPYDGDPLTNGGYPGYKDTSSGSCLREGLSGASCNTEPGWYWSGTNENDTGNFSRVVLLPPGGSPTFYDGSYLVIAVHGEKR